MEGSSEGASTSLGYCDSLSNIVTEELSSWRSSWAFGLEGWLVKVWHVVFIKACVCGGMVVKWEFWVHPLLKLETNFSPSIQHLHSHVYMYHSNGHQ